MRGRGWRIITAACAVAIPVAARAATVNYVMQTGNFTLRTEKNFSPPYSGSYNNTGTEIGQYANTGSFGNTPGAAAFQLYSTTANNNASNARPLEVGDVFTLTGYVFSNPSAGGRIGLSFRTSTDFADFFKSTDSNTAAAFQLDDSGGWKSKSSVTSDSGLAANSDVTFQIRITSSNTYSVTMTRAVGGGVVNYYDLLFNNSLSGKIQSFSVYTYGDSNANSFWKNGSLQDVGSVEFGRDNGSRTISGVISDGRAANLNTGTVANNVVKSGTGSVTFSGSNTYTGTTSINAGTLAITSDGNLGAAPASATDNVFIKDAAVLRAEGNVTLHANRNVILNGTSGTNSWMSVNTGFTLTINGQIKPGPTGPNGLVKFGPGTLLIANSSNTYTGSTYITNGTLSLAAGASIASSADIQVGETSGSNPATLLLADTDGGHSLTNAVVVRSGSSGAKKLVSANSSGTNTFAGNVTLNTSVTVEGTSGGTIAFGGGSIDLKGNTLTIDGANNTYVSALLQNSTGSGKLTKQGSGALTLAPGTHTYTGTTTVNGGKLLVNGTHSGGDDYTINAGTLGGSGTISLASGKKVQVNAGGTVAPGVSPGTLTLSGDMIISGGTNSTLEFEFVGTSGDPADETQGGIDFDVLNVSGTLNLGGARLNVVAPHDGVKYYTPYTIATAGNIVGAFGQLNNQVTTSGQYRLSYPYYNVTIVDGATDSIQVTFVPEPGVAGLVVLGGAGLLRRRRGR